MNAFDNALRHAQLLLNNAETPDTETIRRKVALVMALLRAENGQVDIDEEALVRELENRYTIWIDTWTTLDNPHEDHVAWLPGKRGQIDWKFWRRYMRYVEEEEDFAPRTVNRLDELTDEILGRLEDPHRQGAWDRRGMVVGYVQSGKTANYTGLICKAADAGYKLIIVLAGLNDSLRSQTQLRLDLGFLGFDTQQNRRFNEDNQRIGVGRLKGEPFLIAQSLTSNANNGDFNRRFANQAGIVPGGSEPVLLVVKKYKSVLQNLIQWALSVRSEMDPNTRRRVVRDVPLLVIDDEADNASINTAPLPEDADADDYDVSAINGKIRELLSSFDKKAYVGYTATPFANIFIDPDAETQSRGKDIFPSSFIISLPAPSNYVGPARVFGLQADPDVGIEEVQALPIVRVIDDYEDDYQQAFPPKHSKEHVPDFLPDSLKEAIRAFILVCAARRARGQVNVHNSMLVHVTRFVAVQAEVAELVGDELAYLRRRIAYGDGRTPEQLLDELEDLWRRDFEPTTRNMAEFDPQGVTWEQVSAELHDAVSAIQVKRVNGTAADVLDYVEHPKGLSVIAIGGDKLSRGLTLAGLSVSYYLRATKLYDTLMQMGRWFGYRPGYLDLCRLYTTRELVNWYRHITLADEELRQEFDHMASVNATPRDYALRVRTHPDGLLITAMNKMRTGTVMQLSYAGDIAELPHFHTDSAVVESNHRVTDSFLRSLGTPEKQANLIWRDVPGQEVVSFIAALTTHPMAAKADSGRVADYIRVQLAQGELTNWTVALINNTKAEKTGEVGGHEIGLTDRKNVSSNPDIYSLTKGRLLNPPDEFLDFSPEQHQAALETTRERWRNGESRGKDEPRIPNPKVVREMRRPTRGLLILYPLNPEPVGREKPPVTGYAISFPESENARTIEYRVNDIYWRQLIDSEDV